MSDLVGNPEDRFSQNEAHIKVNKIHHLNFLDDGLRGAFGSMLGSGRGLTSSASDGANSIALSAARRQIFAKTAM